jgi:hypothetical protein
MPDQFFQYDPERVVCMFRGIPISGFMDGTMIAVEYDEDAVMKTVGGQGAVTATVNANRSGKFTFTLVQGSPTNDLLSELCAALRAPGAALLTGPILVKDLNGTTLCSAAEAWVTKIAKTEFAKEITGREWVIDCAKLVMNTGGSVL